MSNNTVWAITVAFIELLLIQFVCSRYTAQGPKGNYDWHFIGASVTSTFFWICLACSLGDIYVCCCGACGHALYCRCLNIMADLTFSAAAALFRG